MYHPKSIEHVEGLARFLCGELAAIAGVTIAYSDCLEAVAGMFGYESFESLCSNIGRVAPSLDDEDVDDVVVERRRRGQLQVLVGLGLAPGIAGDVIDAVRPSGGAAGRGRLARIRFDEDEVEDIGGNLAAVCLHRMLMRVLTLVRPRVEVSGVFADSELVKALVGFGCDDDYFLGSLTRLDGAGVSLGQIMASLHRASREEEGACSGEAAEIARAFSDEVAAFSAFFDSPPAPDEWRREFEEAVENIRLALYFHVVEQRNAARPTFERIRSEIVEGEAVGATPCDLAGLIAYSSGRHPLARIVYADHSSRVLQIVQAIAGGDVELRSGYETTEKILSDAVDGVLRDGYFREIKDFPYFIFDAAVIRADTTAAYALDLLVWAHGAALSPADLARAITAVFESRLAVGSSLVDDALGAGEPTPLPGIDPDLASIAVCCEWSVADWKATASNLTRLQRRGLTLLDICAHSETFSALVLAESHADFDDGVISEMDERDVFVVEGIPEGAYTPGFAILLAAIDCDWVESEFIDGLGDVLDGLSYLPKMTVRRLEAALSPGGRCLTSEDVGRMLAPLRALAKGLPLRDRIEVSALVAGLALGCARFECLDPDDASMGEFGRPTLTATELACELLLDVGLSLSRPDVVASLTVAEIVVVEAVRKVAGRMLDVLSEDEVRLAVLTADMTSTGLNLSGAAFAANDNPLPR